jgi:hypothetical protein
MRAPCTLALTHSLDLLQTTINLQPLFILYYSQKAILQCMLAAVDTQPNRERHSHLTEESETGGLFTMSSTGFNKPSIDNQGLPKIAYFARQSAASNDFEVRGCTIGRMVKRCSKLSFLQNSLWHPACISRLMQPPVSCVCHVCVCVYV